MHKIDVKLCSHLMFENSFRNIERQNNYRKTLAQYIWHCDRDLTWERGSWSPCWPSTCMSTVCGVKCFCSSFWCRGRAPTFDCGTPWLSSYFVFSVLHLRDEILYKCQVCVCLIVSDCKRAILDI